MEFYYKDENDPRIVDCLSEPLDYPRDIRKAPNKKGVYVLFNNVNEVVCVGIASGGNTLKEDLRSAQSVSNIDGIITAFRWFVTRGSWTEENLGNDWMRKYCLSKRTAEKKKEPLVRHKHERLARILERFKNLTSGLLRSKFWKK